MICINLFFLSQCLAYKPSMVPLLRSILSVNLSASREGRGEGAEKSAKSRQVQTGWKRISQMWMSALNKIFIFFIIIWKYFLSNINLIFEYSVLKLECKVYPSPLHTHIHTNIHTHLLHLLSHYQLATETKITFVFVCLSLFDGLPA